MSYVLVVCYRISKSLPNIVVAVSTLFVLQRQPAVVLLQGQNFFHILTKILSFAILCSACIFCEEHDTTMPQKLSHRNSNSTRFCYKQLPLVIIAVKYKCDYIYFELRNKCNLNFLFTIALFLTLFQGQIYSHLTSTLSTSRKKYF